MKLINKKIMLFILCVLLGIIVAFAGDKLSNNKISNFFTLSFLYLKNSEEMTFEGISLKVPFYYIRTQNGDKLTLLKFPPGGGSIFLEKKYISNDTFKKEIKIALHNLHYEIIKEGNIKIDNEKGFYVTASKTSNPSDYREYVNISDKKIVISFLGDKSDSENFWEVVKNIRGR